MDLLSHLLSLITVTGRLEVRCHFGAPWRIDHPESDIHEIPYHVLVSGHAIVEDGHDAPQPLQPGDIVLFPRGAAHQLHDGSGRKPRAAPHRQSTVLTVAENAGKGERSDVLCGKLVLSEAPDRLLRDYLPQRLIVHSAESGQANVAAPGEVGRLARLVQLMREESMEEGPGSATMVNHLSAALFALTLRFASAAEDSPRGLLALAQRPRLQPALAAIFQAPEYPWTLPELAARCHMSRASFVRHFDDAIGRSAFEILTEIRMTLAGHKLLRTELPVEAIGEAVGYRSEAAFQRAFKRHVGVTPARWRLRRGNVEVHI